MALLAAYAVPHPPLIVPAVGRGQEAAIADTIRSTATGSSSPTRRRKLARWPPSGSRASA